MIWHVEMFGMLNHREEDANNEKSDDKEKSKDKVENKVGTAGDDSGSDKEMEIVKEWRTRSRGLEKGTVIFILTNVL